MRRAPKKCQVKPPYLHKAFIASRFTSYIFPSSYLIFSYFRILCLTPSYLDSLLSSLLQNFAPLAFNSFIFACSMRRVSDRNTPRDAPSASLAADPHPYSCLASAQIAIKNSSLRVPLRRVPKKCQIKSPYLGKAFIFIASSFTSYTFLFSYRLFLYFCIFMPYTFIS